MRLNEYLMNIHSSLNGHFETHSKFESKIQIEFHLSLNSKFNEYHH